MVCHKRSKELINLKDGDYKMTLKQLFIDSMNSYNDDRRKSLGVDAKANSVQIIENKIPKILTSNLVRFENYSVKASCGVGRWAEIPWITIMNTTVTSNVSNGYYITYLFSADMKHLYLALMFAVTNNKELEELLRHAHEIIEQSNIQLDPKIINGNIDYLGKGTRAKQYAKATVAYIHYSINNMPEQDDVWIRDLKNMLSLYEYYIKEVKGEEYINSKVVNVNNNDKNVKWLKLNNNDLTYHIHTYIQSKGFSYSLENIKNLYLSLRSKPFVIISGISGTGKTKIVQLFAESIGATEVNGQFKLIPVRPDWSDSSELLGYIDLQGIFKKGPLTEMIEHAESNPELPHFVLLDEMNLARVEYYFSDVLSVMESRKRDSEGQVTSSQLVSFKEEGQEKTVYLPNNLYILGTVNMDETTHPFSKKVLDRANTIEFNEIHLDNFNFLNEKDDIEPIQLSNDQLEAKYINIKDVYQNHQALVEWVSQELAIINEHLQHMKAHVGYRVRDEICFYMAWNEKDESPLLTRDEAFDFCIMQKVLPRILGSGQHVEKTLQGLYQYFTGVEYEHNERPLTVQSRYPKSVNKLVDMLEEFYDVGFTSFWNA